jgi:hypothetical protein
MKFFRARKLNQALTAGRIADALAFLDDPDPEIVQSAWKGARALLAKDPAALRDPAVADPLFRLHDRASELWPAAFDLLLAAGDPRLLPDAMARAMRDPRAPDGRAAFVYLAGLIDGAPDALRGRCQGDPHFVPAVRGLLAAVESITDPAAQGGARLVEFLDLWDDDEVRRGCLQLFCRSRWAHAPALMDLLLTRLLPRARTEMIEPLLYQVGVEPENAALDARVTEAIVSFGEEAREPLMTVMRDYKGSIRSQTQGRTERTPPYFASQKAVALLGRVAKERDREVILFLTEIVADTKLAASGQHKKHAREALSRLA